MLFLSLLAFAPRLATAQDVKNPVVLEKVTYSRAIPKGLRAWVPRGGKSRFWGATNLKYNGKQVWVHVYDLQKADYPKDQENVDGVQKCGVDLFALSTPEHLNRILSTRFHYGRYGGYKRGSDPETVGVETLWLDPKTRRIPIVKVELQNRDGLYGTVAQDAFVVLKPNLKTAIVQQQFGYGSSNSAGVSHWETRFGIDKAGLLTINYLESGRPFLLRTATYQWRKNRFKAGKVTIE